MIKLVKLCRPQHKEFYNKYINEEKTELTKIKINNKVLHQSKLINYFKVEKSSKNITKDLNDSLKKVKKNKRRKLFGRKKKEFKIIGTPSF